MFENVRKMKALFYTLHTESPYVRKYAKAFRGVLSEEVQDSIDNVVDGFRPTHTYEAELQMLQVAAWMDYCEFDKQQNEPQKPELDDEPPAEDDSLPSWADYYPNESDYWKENRP